MPQNQLTLSQLFYVFKTPNYFGPNWYIVPSNSSEQDLKGVWVNKVIRTSTEILKFSILWLLSGEYVLINKSVNNSCKSAIDLLLKEVQKISNQFDNITDDNVKYEIQSSFKSNILHVINVHIKRRLVYFERDTKNQFQFADVNLIIRGDLKENQEIDQDVRHYLRAFVTVFGLIKIEQELYDTTKETIKNLLIILNEINNTRIEEPLKKAIEVKVNFLLKKIMYRRNGENNDELLYSFLGSDDKKLSIDQLQIPNELESWESIIKVHYGLVNDYKIQQRNRLTECEINNNQFKFFHAKIKILKDDKRDLVDAFLLLEDFKSLEDPIILLDDYASKVTQSYLFNNCISLKCEKDNLSISDLKDIYADIRNHQNSIRIKNYFPWQKLADTISNKMESLSDRLIDKEAYNEFKELLKLLDKIVENKLEECWEWCKSKRFTPVQMPFNECLSEYKIKIDNYPEVKLFFFSSFILPINYQQDGKARIELKLTRTKFDALKAVYEKLQTVVEEVKYASEKMKKQERRSVEILAIFSAVALFSVGSIQIFSRDSIVQDPNVYYKFIIAFGYSLCLFVVLIWLITRDDIRKISKGHIIILLVLFIGGFFILGQAFGGNFINVLK